MRYPYLKRRGNWLRGIIGVVVSGVLVWWCLRGTDTLALLQALRAVPGSAVLCGLTILWLSLPLRAHQWHLLLRYNLASPSLLLRLTCLGAAANLVMPLRGGEFVKVALLHRWGHVPLRKAAVSLVLCRLQDIPPIGIAMGIAVFYFDALGISEPRSTDSSKYLVAFLTVLVCLTLISFVVVRQLRHLPIVRAVHERLFIEIRELVGALPSVRAFFQGQATALACWFLFVLSAVPLAHALLNATWGGALQIAIVVSAWTTAATLLPAAPTGIGTVHAACVSGLLTIRPETERESALAFAIVLHAVGAMGPAIPALLPAFWRNDN